MPQPQQHGIQAVSVTYAIVHSNAGSFNPLSKARDGTCVLMDTSWVRYHCATGGTPLIGFFFFAFFSAFSRAPPTAYGGSQARGLMGAVAAGLHQNHSNAGSEPCLQPTPQLTAMLDPLTH